MQGDKHMRNVVALLDSIGGNAALRYATASELSRTLIDGNVSRELSTALLQGDRQTLETLLKVNTNVCCAVHAPEETEHEENGLK
jgi:hypothetical protein